jgi:D-arabinose 1-dehydrogenase-like Zn-dependent alcohol dehydrogenase
VFPYIGPEMIESFLARCGRGKNRSSRKQRTSQLSHHQAETKSTEEGMKSGSVEGTIVRVKKPRAPLEIDQTEFPYPSAGHVRLRVEACGICQTDAHLRDGLVPGMSFPFTPGHEVVGRIEALGEATTEWRLGQRVGVGWHGGRCGVCAPCRRGDFLRCVTPQVPGLTYPGGYADYMNVPADALVAIPEELSSVAAAPLLCAGVTIFNALTKSDAQTGDLVAIHGLEGVGHLGVQFAAKLGFRTVAIGRGCAKSACATRLGAEHCIDSENQDVVKTLQDLGGAKLILATVTNSDVIMKTIGGLAHKGEYVCLGISTEPIGVTPIQLIMQGQFIVGAPCGTASDLEETLQFATLSGVRPMVERFPLARVADAFDRLLSGKARFRVVLEMDAEPVESRNEVPFPRVHAGELQETRETVSLFE